MTTPDERRPHPLSDDPRPDVSRFRAERKPNADLARALLYGIRHDAVDAERRQQESGDGEDGHQQRPEVRSSTPLLPPERNPEPCAACERHRANPVRGR